MPKESNTIYPYLLECPPKFCFWGLRSSFGGNSPVIQLFEQAKLYVQAPNAKRTMIGSIMQVYRIKRFVLKLYNTVHIFFVKYQKTLCQGNDKHIKVFAQKKSKISYFWSKFGVAINKGLIKEINE